MDTLTKEVLIVAQVMMFAFCIIGCSRAPESAIEKILNECAKNTEIVNNSDMSDYEAAQFLASEMQKMDTRDCPPDFREVFQQHINAWRDMDQVQISSTYNKLVSIAAKSGARVPESIVR